MEEGVEIQSTRALSPILPLPFFYYINNIILGNLGNGDTQKKIGKFLRSDLSYIKHHILKIVFLILPFVAYVQIISFCHMTYFSIIQFEGFFVT